MIHCHMITVGKTGPSYLTEGEEEYLKRLQHYCRVTVHAAKAEKIIEGRPFREILKAESQRMERLLVQGWVRVALDRQGDMPDTLQLAKRLDRWQTEGVRDVAFLIGGPLGLDDSMVRNAEWTFSLSRLTFNHDMVRLILLEQLYRCFSYLRGEKYHK
jgi:23S rRNA (pseudouridine1915-N3)-methyltransferase